MYASVVCGECVKDVASKYDVVDTTMLRALAPTDVLTHPQILTSVLLELTIVTRPLCVRTRLALSRATV